MFELRRHDGAGTIALLDRLADAYIEGYADDPDVGRSIYARDEFLRRTTRQAQSDDFRLITAQDGESLSGFSFGLRFPAGRWWSGVLDTPAPDDLLASEKFAVIELVVLPNARGRGLATQLMTALLQDRPEPVATLLADQSGHARTIYDRWGWQRIGTVRPAPDVPYLDILIRSL
jgi:GNAT superfamily N-acetyltransferase